MIARIKGLRIQELRDCKQEVSSEKRGVCSMHRDEPKRQLHNFFNPFVETQELVLPEDETAWRILLEMAERARQLPVLAERLKQFDVPQKARDELTFAKSRTVAISAMHQELIHKISDAFTETGIQFQVLKGVVWSRLLHRKLGLRQTGDLDVLVMAKDLRKAEEVLNKLGYFRDALRGVFGIESPFEEDVKWFQHPAKNHYSSQYWTDEEPCFSAKIFSRLLVDRADNVISSMFRTFFPSVHLMKKLYPQNGNKPLSPYFQHYKYLALRLTR